MEQKWLKPPIPGWSSVSHRASSRGELGCTVTLCHLEARAGSSQVKEFTLCLRTGLRRIAQRLQAETTGLSRSGPHFSGQMGGMGLLQPGLAPLFPLDSWE